MTYVPPVRLAVERVAIANLRRARGRFVVAELVCFARPLRAAGAGPDRRFVLRFCSARPRYRSVLAQPCGVDC
jgi:hypothetical protein